VSQPSLGSGIGLTIRTTPVPYLVITQSAATVRCVVKSTCSYKG